MAELLDFEGRWDLELIELMLPVAIDLEAKGTQAQYNATVAAVARLFSKDGDKPLIDALQATERDVVRAQLRARGLDEQALAATGEDAASKFMKIFARMGIRPEKGVKKNGKPGARRNGGRG